METLTDEKWSSWALRLFNKVSLSVTCSLRLEESLEAALRTIVQLLECKGGMILLDAGPGGGRRTVTAAAGRGDEEFLPLAESAIIAASDLHGSLVIGDLESRDLPGDLPEDLPYREMAGHGVRSFVCVPYSKSGRMVFALSVWWVEAGRPTGEHVDVLLELCSRLWRYVELNRENAATYERAEAEHRRVELLYELTRELSQQHELVQIFEKLASLLRRLGADSVSIIIEEEDGAIYFRSNAPGREDLTGPAGTLLARHLIEKGLEGWALKNNRMAVVSDVGKDGRWYKASFLIQGDRSALIAPFEAGRAGARGVLTLANRRVGAFDDVDLEMMELVASQIGVAIENTILYRNQMERSLHLSIINEVGQAATSILNIDLMLQIVVKAIRRRLGHLAVGVFLFDQSRRVARLFAFDGSRDMEIRPGCEIRPGRGCVGWVLEQGDALIINDVTVDSLYVPLDESWGDVRSELALPMKVGTKIIGVLDLQSASLDGFGTHDKAAMQTLADHLAIAIENARLYDEISQRVDELGSLNEIGQSITSTLDMQKTLTLITQHTTRLMGVEAASVVLVDEEEGDLWFAAASGGGSETVKDSHLPVGQGIAGWVVQNGEPVIVPDVRTDTRFFPNMDRESGFVTRSILCVPLRSKGQTIGALEVMNKEVGTFDSEDLRLLTYLAIPAATAIENAQLYDKLRKRMRQLEEAQSQLLRSARLAAVGELSAGLAHELNNPLTSIINFASFLLEDVSNSTPQDHDLVADLVTINQEAQRARRIVRGLLDFARAGEPHFVTADLNAIIGEAIKLVYTPGVRGTVHLSTHFGDLPPMRLDVNQVKQVIVNLLNNAVQAMPDGGELTVSTRLVEAPDGQKPAGKQAEKPPEKFAEIKVSDTGCGIPEEHLDKIFAPFFTTKGAGQGTGLGLSVSHGIVERHGGSIHVETGQGVGSTFTITLPIFPANPELIG